MDDVADTDSHPSLVELVRGKRVLEVGDPGSPFLAYTLAPGASAWYVVGRYPPDSDRMLPAHCQVTNTYFEAQSLHLAPELIDVIIFACPSPLLTQDEACLKWATVEHQIVVLTDRRRGVDFGSPGFWKIARELTVEKEFLDETFHYLFLRKSSPAQESQDPEPFHRHFPKKGQRYRLVPSYHWPNKKHGEKPPVVIIAGNWTKSSGHAELANGGGVLALRLGDLGVRM